MLPLLPLLLPCCSAQSRKAVVALRGDAFRFGHNSKQGCVHVNQSYANQLWQVESIKRYVMEPLRAAGYAVAVTGVVYAGCDAAWTRAIAAALAPASDATRIDFALPRRDEHQQRVVFALAVDHAFRLHPDAAFVVVSRLDVTYCRAMRRPNGTLWRASLGVGVGTGARGEEVVAQRAERVELCAEELEAPVAGDGNLDGNGHAVEGRIEDGPVRPLRPAR